MRIYAGLKPDDWQRWGQFTTFKSNAAELLAKELRPEQRIYCSPMVDPYQPAESDQRQMRGILESVVAAPPRVFTVQTRGPLILRDLDLLRQFPNTLRVSFSVPTNRNEVLKLYEPHAPSFEERMDTIRRLSDAGIETYATLAPLLPSDPEKLAEQAIEATGRDLIGDPLHVREVKPRGATTRDAAFRISEVNGFTEWLNADFQAHMVARIQTAAARRNKTFATGPTGFARLAI
jgi:DNA repair photolyase